VPARGGVPVQITAIDSARQATVHCCPSFLPYGRRLIRATNVESGISTGLLRMAVGFTITAIDPLRRKARSIGA